VKRKRKKKRKGKRKYDLRESGKRRERKITICQLPLQLYIIGASRKMLRGKRVRERGGKGGGVVGYLGQVKHRRGEREGGKKGDGDQRLLVM